MALTDDMRALIFAELTVLLLASGSPLSADAAAPVSDTAFAPARNDPIARRCDELASPTTDPQRVGPGVPYTKMDIDRAVPGCQKAAAERPASPRYQYLYGRTLDTAKRYEEAAAQYALADQGGYPRAAAALGSLYADGLGVQQDPDKEAELYTRAADAGFGNGFARVMLGSLYADGFGVDHDTDKARIHYAETEHDSNPKVVEMAESYFAKLEERTSGVADGMPTQAPQQHAALDEDAWAAAIFGELAVEIMMSLSTHVSSDP